MATCLGRKLTRAYQGEAGNDFSTRIRRTRIRHRMGPAGIKLYDKLGLVARVECTTIDDSDAPLKALHRVSRPVKQKGRSYRGFNLFLESDYHLFLTLVRGEWTLSGFQARDLRHRLSWLTLSRCSYLLKRLRTHGLIKKVGRRYKYYLTQLGRRVLVSALHLRESVVLPSLCETQP